MLLPMGGYMKSNKPLDPNLNMWLLMAKLHYKMVLVRRAELSPQDVTPRQMYILQLIDDLGSKATLSNIAQLLERKLDAVARKAVDMEKARLINRIKMPKSRLLKLELTKKGNEILNSGWHSKGMKEVSSILNKEERRQLYSILNRLLSKVNEYTSEGEQA
jgi:DNA-binding MarR family transcriptional regulator